MGSFLGFRAWRAACALAAAGVALAAAAAPAAPLRITGAWARATPPGVDTGAAYFTIVNGDAADQLLGARSAAAREVELHESTQRGDVVEMQRLDSLPIAAGATVALAPGAGHLMLVGLARPLVAGGEITVTLLFERAGPIEVTVPIVDARSSAPPAQHAHPAP